MVVNGFSTAVSRHIGEYGLLPCIVAGKHMSCRIHLVPKELHLGASPRKARRNDGGTNCRYCGELVLYEPLSKFKSLGWDKANIWTRNDRA